MSDQLVYRRGAMIEELKPNECTIHPAANSTGARWWNLWMYVFRDDVAGVLEDYVVPVLPGGSFTANGPGGKTWGLQRTAPGTWQVAPSINVEADQVHELGPTARSRWHHTPAIVGVPEGEPWQ